MIRSERERVSCSAYGTGEVARPIGAIIGSAARRRSAGDDAPRCVAVDVVTSSHLCCRVRSRVARKTERSENDS